MVAEKRRAHRIRVTLSARYRSSAVSLDGWVKDLSRDGLFLRSEFLDSAGAMVDMDLDLPGDVGPVSIVGEVVRIDDHPLTSGMGIRFTRVDAATKRRLANFMLVHASRLSGRPNSEESGGEA